MNKVFDNFISGYNLIIFTEPTCKECYDLKQNYFKIKQIFPKLKLHEINPYENKEFAQKLEIYSLPSCALYFNQELIAVFNKGRYKTIDSIIKFIQVYKEYYDSKQLLQ